MQKRKGITRQNRTEQKQINKQQTEFVFQSGQRLLSEQNLVRKIHELCTGSEHKEKNSTWNTPVH